MSLVYDGRLAPEVPPQGEIGWVMGEQGYLEPVYATDFPFLDDNEGIVAYDLGVKGTHSGKSGGLGNTLPHDPQDPFATAEIKFCMNWLAGYVDADFGEDYLVIPSWWSWLSKHVPASYARVRVVHEDGTHIWDDYLDEDGCTPYLDVGSFTEYTLEMWTDMEKDSGTTSPKKITVLQQAADVWEDEEWAEILYFGVQTSALVDGSQYTVELKPWFGSRATNVAPVAALVLRHSGKMAYLDGMETYISTKLDGDLGCTGTYYTGYAGHVCVVFDRPYWKYVIAHEIGHRVGAGQTAWFCAGYDIDDETAVYSSNANCNCDHIPEWSNNFKGRWHCLQSREEIKTAQGEGWAHAYGTMLFNQQGSTSGNDAAFVYYKAMNYVIEDPIPWSVEVLPPIYVNAKNNITRMEQFCDDNMVRNGTEQDWLVFFTTVWQDTTNRFSAAELIAVSDLAPVTSYWSNLVWAVGVLHTVDTPKYDHFTLKGDQAGVNH